MKARRGFLAIVLTVLAIAVAVPPDFGYAQQQRRLQPAPVPQQRRGGFLELLFGPGFLQPSAPQGQQQRRGFFGQPLLPPVQTQPRRPSEPPIAVVEITPKDPDAKKVLVLGDFVAGGLAWGLDQTFAKEPKLVVIDRSNNASGLVRADYYDWNSQLLTILNEEKPDIVVIEIGVNDRQQMRIDKQRLAPRSPEWELKYTERIRGMADTLKVFGRPFFWVSAPPIRQSSAMRDMAYLNELYKPAVEAASGRFVDIWGGFTNEDGLYISSGPDVEGQLRALRAGDGINFTRAGRLKIAFYVEREMRQQTGIGAGAVDLVASADQKSQIEIGPDGQKRLVGPVISLSDPLPGASDMLAGGPNEAATKPGETPQYLMIVKGSALPPVAGRADDFTWPPRLRSSASTTAAPPQAAAN